MDKVEAETCTPEDTARDAAKAMKSCGCGCSPVVEDKRDFKLVRVVTPHDISHYVAAEDLKASEVAIKDIMKPMSACCKSSETLDEAGQKCTRGSGSQRLTVPLELKNMNPSKIIHVLNVLVGVAGIVTTLVGTAAGDGRILGFTREHFLFCAGLLMLIAIWLAVNTVRHVMLEKTGDVI